MRPGGQVPEPTVDTVIRIGVLTPHEVPGPEVEFAAMAPGHVATRVVRITGTAGASASSGPVSPAELGPLTTAPLLDRAAAHLLTDPVDVIGYASTTSAYTILKVERVALVGAPWFASEFNDLGAAYFASQGFDVVSSESAGLSHDPGTVEPAAVCEWTSRHVADAAEAVFFGGNGFRAAGTIQALETAIGRAALSSNQVLLWQLLAHADTRFEINGYGRLFAHKP
jgi:maleate isomerase